MFASHIAALELGKTAPTQAILEEIGYLVRQLDGNLNNPASMHELMKFLGALKMLS
jgi:hypothetical protein